MFRHADDRFEFGSIGVDFFFVISGFVMAKISANRAPVDFIIDRAWRIFPIYWILVSYDLLMNMAGGRSATWAAFNLSLISKWFGFSDFAWGHTWTLAYELAFYGLVALAMLTKRPLVSLGIFAAALALRPFTSNPLIAFAGSPIAIEFLFGIAIAKAPLKEKAGGAFAAVGLFWLILFPNSWLEPHLLAQTYLPALTRVALWGLPAALIIYGCLSCERHFTRWAEPFVWLGFASYSIYLIHMNVTERFALPWWALVIASLWTGFACWYFIERPLLKMKPRDVMALFAFQRSPAPGVDRLR